MARQKTEKEVAAPAVVWMSTGEYALHRNVHIQTVYGYLRRGRIPTETRDGQKFINQVVADKILDALPKAHVQTGNMIGELLSADTPAESYMGNRAKRERYEMELKRVAYEQKIGKLIPKDSVEKIAFEVARVTRDSLLAIPDRISADLAAEPDPQKVHFMLTEALLAALNHGLADPLKGIKNLGSEAEEILKEPDASAAVAAN